MSTAFHFDTMNSIACHRCVGNRRCQWNRLERICELVAVNQVTVLSVRHWTDRLFSFTTPLADFIDDADRRHLLTRPIRHSRSSNSLRCAKSRAIALGPQHYDAPPRLPDVHTWDIGTYPRRACRPSPNGVFATNARLLICNDISKSLKPVLERRH